MTFQFSSDKEAEIRVQLKLLLVPLNFVTQNRCVYGYSCFRSAPGHCTMELHPVCVQWLPFNGKCTQKELHSLDFP